MPLVRISLFFAGRLDPELVTSSLGLKPKSAGRKGEPIAPGIPKARVEDQWRAVLAEKPEAGSEIDALLTSAFDMLHGRRDALAAIGQDSRISGSVLVYVEVPPGEWVPGIELLPGWAQLLSDGNLSFVVDATLLAPEDLDDDPSPVG